jgi:S1-C subfamily serine protease
LSQVANGSDAERKQIRPGYLIQEMEWRQVDNLETYSRLVTKLKEGKKEKVLLYVKSPDGRGGGYVTVDVSISDR